MIDTKTIEATLTDIPEGQPTRLSQDGEGILVLRRGNEIKAYLDICPHAGWKLSDGELEGNLIECPGHTWRFDMMSGRCADVPAYRLTPVNVIAEGDKVFFNW